MRQRRTLRVCAAFFAEADRCAAVRLRAALRACFASAVFDAALRGARFSAFFTARARFFDGRFVLARFYPTA